MLSYKTVYHSAIYSKAIFWSWPLARLSPALYDAGSEASEMASTPGRILPKSPCKGSLNLPHCGCRLLCVDPGKDDQWPLTDPSLPGPRQYFEDGLWSCCCVALTLLVACCNCEQNNHRPNWHFFSYSSVNDWLLAELSSIGGISRSCGFFLKTHHCSFFPWPDLEWQLVPWQVWFSHWSGKRQLNAPN